MRHRSCRLTGSYDLRPDSITKAANPSDTILFNDSITRILPGVEVESERYYYKGNKSVFRPSRNEKNASTDAIDLLRRMQLPQLESTPGGVTVSGGGNLTYFVNGHPASDDELTGMFMKDVKSVVYLEYPSDPKYLGSPYVVDFIVQEYEYGGYTKLSLDDYFIRMTSNREMLFSRFSYKKMTYDLSTSFKNYHGHHYMTQSEETFNTGSNAIVMKSTPSASDRKFISFPLKLRVAYSNNKTYLTNTFGFRLLDESRNETEGDITYSNNPGKDYSYTSSSPNKSVSATWDGYLSQQLGNGWSLASSDYVYYTHRNISDRYATSLPLEINNIMREDAFNGRIDLNISKSVNQDHNIFAEITGALDTSRIDYTGSTDQSNEFDKWLAAVKVGYQYGKGNFYAYTHAGIGYERNRDNDFVVNTVYPYGVISLNYNPNQRHKLSLWTQYSTFSCGADMQNPTLVQRNDMMYVKGNPELDPYGRFEITGKYSWTIVPYKFYLSSSLGFNDKFNRYIPVFDRMSGSDAVVMTYKNMGDAKYSFLNLGFRWRAIGEKLVFDAHQAFRFYRPSETYLPDINYRYGYYGILSYLGAFNMAFELWSYGKCYGSELMNEVVKKRPFYRFSFGWGNGSWTLSLMLVNIFRKSWKIDESFIYSPIYNAHNINLGNDSRQMIRVQATYAFNYGKKIKISNQLSDDVSSSSSAIIR